jgi:hypothetical protein
MVGPVDIAYRGRIALSPAGKTGRLASLLENVSPTVGFSDYLRLERTRRGSKHLVVNVLVFWHCRCR